jgi:CRP-like cAMP-binding protein
LADLTQRERIALRSSPMFTSLSDEAIDEIIDPCTKIQFLPGEPITRPEEQALWFFVILAGHVRVYNLLPSGEQEVIQILGPGQSFAEAETMKGLDYPASSEAVDPVTLLAIDREVFQEAMNHNVELVAGLVKDLSDKLQDLAEIAGQHDLPPATARLAQYLLAECKAAGKRAFPLSEPLESIAEFVGVETDTLLKMLEAMHLQGVIHIQEGQIIIVNEEAICGLAADLKPPGQDDD